MNTTTQGRGSMSHYLFRFNQAKEDLVRKNAKRYGIEVIAPRVTTWRKGKRGTKPKPVAVPAFHSYLILGFELEQAAHALMDLHHSVKPMLIPYDGHEWTLARIPLAEIGEIKSNKRFKRPSAAILVEKVIPDPKYTKGECVRILGGAATGLQGRIICADPKAREAELDMTNWPAKLTVSYDILERVA